MAATGETTKLDPNAVMGVAGGPLTATPASEWKRKSREGEWYTLPGSGNVAKLRRPGLIALALKGTAVPNPLAASITKFLAEDSGDILSRRTEQQNVERFQKNSEALGAMARLVFMDPVIVPDGQTATGDHEIELSDVVDADLAWIGYAFLEGQADKVDEFRVDRSDGTSRFSRQALQAAAERDSKDTNGR